MSEVKQGGSESLIRILHVDDDPDHLMASKRFLQKFDPCIKINSTTSIQEVLDQLSSYDCVLLDYKMLNMTGLELAEKIREKSDIPIILYTGRGSEEVAEAAFEVGIDDYIRKEFEPAHYQVLARRIKVVVERQRAVSELKRSEDSLTKAQRIAHLGNWDWHIVENELYWSDEIYRIFGLEPQEFGATYEAFIACVHPDDREHVKKSVDEALYRNRPYSIDHRIVLPDNRERTVHEQAEVTFDGSGEPVRMIGTVQDISERKLMEDMLAESAVLFRDIAEHSVDAIFTLDLDGNIMYMSPSIENILGLKAESVVEHPFFDFIPEWNQSKAQGQFMDLIMMRGVGGIEFPILRKDGSRCYVELKVAPIVRDGDIVHLQGLLRDVTEKAHLREEVRRLKEILSEKEEPSHIHMTEDHVMVTE